MHGKNLLLDVLQVLLDICGLVLSVGEVMFCDDVTKNDERVLLHD